MRQSPLSPATAPERVRESVEPRVMPMPIAPTARPLWPGPAREAAVCGSTVVVDRASVATVRVARFGAAAATSSPAVVSSSNVVASRRSRATSASGTTRAMPSAYPTWAAVAIRLAADPETSSPDATASSRGCGK
ncbi:hypothetical protein WQO_14160 [Streptomyces globisporus C-1027]|uniref:Uncharacterized protein n=1 Tax=Streptomyces globisporus C-1027 TaxID=1172567 RepID=A0A0U3LDH6_STRGL|nr:hypothetical protein WQO_14160 [Streptomyces globisporus C-1027]